MQNMSHTGRLCVCVCVLQCVLQCVCVCVCVGCRVDAKADSVQQIAEALQSNTSSDDDLALGVEASVYGKQGVRTVQEFLRWSGSSQNLSRWNSDSSETSGHSGPLSVMDILNLWKDDPEDLLFELGFGRDEPDLSGRIPARFINHQSHARGINLQVFLEAQKNRLDLENPDVSNRFRELEVLQQVTTAFSCLVGSSSSPFRAPHMKDVTPEAQERRRRVGMLFRRASKKSISQIHRPKIQDPKISATNPHQPQPSPRERRLILRRLKAEPLDMMLLSPLAEEIQYQPQSPSSGDQQEVKSEDFPPTSNCLWERSPGHPWESFEKDENQSFDSAIIGSTSGGAEQSVRTVMETSSCHSDSSGFLEEPFVPSDPQLLSPGSELPKVLTILSTRNTEEPLPPHVSLSLSLTSSFSLLTDTHTFCGPSLNTFPVFAHSEFPTLLCFPTSDQKNSKWNIDTIGLKDPLFIDADRLKDTLSIDPDRLKNSPSIDRNGLKDSVSIDPDKLTEPLDINPDKLKKNLSIDADSLKGFLSLDPDRLKDLLITDSVELKDSLAIDPDRLKDPLAIDPDGLKGSFFIDPDGVKYPLKTDSVELKDSPSIDPDGLKHSLAIDPEKLKDLPFIDPDRLKDSLFIDPDGQKDPLITESVELKTSVSIDPERLKDPLDIGPEKQKKTLSIDADSLEGFLSIDPDRLKDPASIDPDELKDPLITDSVELKDTLAIEPDGLKDSPSIDPDELKDPLKTGSVELKESLAIDPDGMKDSLAIDLDGLKDSLAIDQDGLKDSLALNPHGLSLSCPHALISKTVEGITSFLFKLGKNIPSDSSPPLQDCGSMDQSLPSNDKEDFINPAVGIKGGLTEHFTTKDDTPCSHDDRTDSGPVSLIQDDKLFLKSKPDRKNVCKMTIDRKASESPGYVPKAHQEIEEKPNVLIEITSLDMIFDTSVDGSDIESEDMQDFFQELDTERRVYWAEPVHISDQTHVLEESESDSFNTSDKSVIDFLFPDGSCSSSFNDKTWISSHNQASSDTSSSLNAAESYIANTNTRTSCSSVSVQMSSCLSSHIVHRTDVPYMTASKQTLLQNPLPLDTSTPFRAVQSWTDLQIQRNALTKKFSNVALDTALNMSPNDTTQKPVNFSLAKKTIPEMANSYETLSVDTGLWPDEEEEIDGDVNKEKMLWDQPPFVRMSCYQSCNHQCSCCTEGSCNKQHRLRNISYSLNELEEMTLCVQQFRSILRNMEEQLSEDQAAVYAALSEQDREKVEDIEELRREVTQEAAELEMQLHELAHHHDESLKMKMHRLLDEQSLLCSQLRVFPPGDVPGWLNCIPSRTVATQCSLLPCVPAVDLQSHL